jgi:hypothetical protein
VNTILATSENVLQIVVFLVVSVVIVQYIIIVNSLCLCNVHLKSAFRGRNSCLCWDIKSRMARLVLTKFLLQFAPRQVTKNHTLCLNQKGEKLVQDMTFELEPIQNFSSNLVRMFYKWKPICLVHFDSLLSVTTRRTHKNLKWE